MKNNSILFWRTFLTPRCWESKKERLFCLSVIFLFVACKKELITTAPVLPIVQLKVQLGQDLFFDKSLSNPVGLSCSSCHAPETAFTDLNHSIVSEGAVDGLYGNRNAPSIAYSMFTPSALHYSIPDSSYKGGFFLDGRVNTLVQQAQKPFLNELEMNNPNPAAVIFKLNAVSYFPVYRQVYGDVTDVAAAFNNIADAIAAYEASVGLTNRFTSKYDYYLKGQASLTVEELSGMQLFSDTLRGKCTKCHLISLDPSCGKALFTDFTYSNDGVPKNPDNPYYTIPSAFNPSGSNYVDVGLGDFVINRAYNGMFKVSTLRNIAITAPYFHNGCFNTLDEVVHFYNIRNLPGSGYPPPEVASNIDTVNTGNLHLTPQEEKDIVSFLKTLTDGYK